MELELGLKLTRGVDDFTSYFQIAKDPLFLSTKTDAMFILTAHLKGYKRESIKIEINEDGTIIAISGERQVKERVWVGWEMYYKENTETKEGFKKVFRIPDGVILDKIKANYNEDESTLKITMPVNKVKGIRGTNINEIKEKHKLDHKEGSSSNLQIGDDNANSQATGTYCDQENAEMPSETRVIESGNEEKQEEDDQNVHDLKTDNIQETSEHIQDVHENNNNENEGPFGKEENEYHDKSRGKIIRCKMCIPIVAGSTLLLSFVVFVFQMIRRNNQTSRKRD